MTRLSDELLDAGRDHTPNLNRLAVLEVNVWICRVCRLQLGSTETLVKNFHGELAVDDRYDDAAMHRGQRAINEDHVAIINPGLAHRLACNAEQEGGLWVLDQHFSEIDSLGGKVVGGRWEASAHRKAHKRNYGGECAELDGF